MIDWLNSISDNQLHHIGEYFKQRYGIPFQKKNGEKLAAFKRWWLNQNTNQIEKTISQKKFETTRDSDTYGFFIRRKP